MIPLPLTIYPGDPHHCFILSQQGDLVTIHLPVLLTVLWWKYFLEIYVYDGKKGQFSSVVFEIIPWIKRKKLLNCRGVQAGLSPSVRSLASLEPKMK